MDMSGETILAAPRPTVWAALNDPAILRQCIEGCEQLERREDGTLDGVVTAKVGPVKARFSGLVTLSDIIEGQRYTLSGEGKGGVAGFAKGRAEVSLADVPEGTLLRYDVKATVGGKLAQLGARLIDAAARGYADAFFARLKLLVEAPADTGADATAVSAQSAAAPAADHAGAQPPSPDAVPAAPPPAAAAPVPEQDPAGLPAWAWASAVVIGVGILLFWLLRS